MTEHQKIQAICDDIARTLRADDFPFTVMVNHEDGTQLLYRHAFAKQYYDPDHRDWGASPNPGMWLMVFTEHQGHHVYCCDDLARWAQFIELPVVYHGEKPVEKFACNACSASFYHDFKSCPYCGVDIEGMRTLTPDEQAKEVAENREYHEGQRRRVVDLINTHFDLDRL